MMILIHIHTEKKPNSENDDWEHFLDFVDLKVIFDSSDDDWTS